MEVAYKQAALEQDMTRLQQDITMLHQVGTPSQMSGRTCFPGCGRGALGSQQLALYPALCRVEPLRCLSNNHVYYMSLIFAHAALLLYAHRLALVSYRA